MNKLLPMHEYLEAVGARTQRMADAVTVLGEQMTARDQVIAALGQLVCEYQAILEGVMAAGIDAGDVDAWYAKIAPLNERTSALLRECMEHAAVSTD